MHVKTIGVVQIFGDVAAKTFGVSGSNKGIPIGNSKKSDSFTIGLLHIEILVIRGDGMEIASLKPYTFQLYCGTVTAARTPGPRARNTWAIGTNVLFSWIDDRLKISL